MMVALGLTVTANAGGIAVVDLAKVVESSTYLKQQNASLGQSVKPTSTKLEQLGKEIEGLQQKAQSANQADLQKLSAQYQAKVNEFNTTQQSLQPKATINIDNFFIISYFIFYIFREKSYLESTTDFKLNRFCIIAFLIIKRICIA